MKIKATKAFGIISFDGRPAAWASAHANEVRPVRIIAEADYRAIMRLVRATDDFIHAPNESKAVGVAYAQMCKALSALHPKTRGGKGKKP